MRKEEIEMRVYGRVQGVYFRDMAKRKAGQLDITGMIMNRDDGSVEIVVQGEHSRLKKFLEWAQENPGFSLVRGISYQWRKPSRDFPDFSILKNNSFFVDKAKSVIQLGKSIFRRKSAKIPFHVAIIPDGNRRWAKKKGLEPSVGHYTSASFQHLREIIREARILGVKYLTLWGFSTENWKRDKGEISAIFDMIFKNVEQFREEAFATKIRFRHLGRKDRIPKELTDELKKLEEETKCYSEFNVQLCLDYGGRDEILRAVNIILDEGERDIDEKLFEKHLDSYGIPNVDLIIRTSGEQRLSGFMPFQSAYAELYFSEVHFPDFDARELRKAIEDYGKRQRRFGGDVKK